MEPANLNHDPHAPDDARLAALLRDATPPLPDGGFSARVLAQLPPPVAPSRASPRLAVCLVGALAGAGFAVWRATLGSGPQFVQSGFGDLRASAAQMAQTLTVVADPPFMLALIVTTLSLLFVFRREVGGKLLS